MQGRVQFRDLLNASVLLFGRTIKYCVTNIGRKFPTSLSTLYYKTPVFPTGSTLQYHKSNTLALSKSLNWTLLCTRRRVVVVKEKIRGSEEKTKAKVRQKKCEAFFDRSRSF